MKKTDSEFYLFGRYKNEFENTGRTQKEVGDHCWGCLSSHRDKYDRTLGRTARYKSKTKRQRVKE